MPPQETHDSRADLLDILLEKIAADTYPSTTMMNIVEQLIQPDEVPAYAAVLMQKIRDDTYPSTSLMRRLVQLTT